MLALLGEYEVFGGCLGTSTLSKTLHGFSNSKMVNLHVRYSAAFGSSAGVLLQEVERVENCCL